MGAGAKEDHSVSCALSKSPRFPVHEYVGAIHIHSNYSDGNASIPEIAEIAGSVGLDFLMFTDHMTLEPLKHELEGWCRDPVSGRKVLVLIGYEINDSEDRNHYLAFNINEALPPDWTAKEYVHGVRQRGGIGFIAHPDEKRIGWPRHSAYPWTDWGVSGYDGIEIWNHSSEWVEKVNRRNAMFRYMHPRGWLDGPSKITLARWDRLNEERLTAGIGGIDAHDFRHQILGLLSVRIFPYKVQLQAIRTHVLMQEPLSPDVERSKRILYDALVQARCFISHFRWGDARGFRWWAEVGSEAFGMGTTFPFQSGITVHTVLPATGEIAVVHSGEVIYRKSGDHLSLPVDGPGIYRIEVRRKGKPWIFSNPIRILNT